jgi:hypothetical protein
MAVCEPSPQRDHVSQEDDEETTENLVSPVATRANNMGSPPRSPIAVARD